MRSKRQILTLVAALAAGLVSASCDKFNVPRFSHEPVGGPVAPISVRVVLDQQLQNAILTQPVCDNQLWEGHIAEVLTHSIQDAGRTRFKATQVVAASETTAPSQPPADYQVLLRLVNKDFVAKDRTGSTDQYMARIDLDLAATYQAVLPDGTVRTMGEGPLRYSDNFSIFTPRVGQAGGRCLTGELDGTLAKATRSLTDQLFAVVAQLPAGGPSSTAVAGAASGPVGTTLAPQATVAAPMILRVSLLDDNKNHILEPGEKIGLRVDATNTGAGVITHAPLSLGGTPSLIDAFAQSGAGSPDLGPINPGATKSTVLWGRMPSSLAADRGELTVSVTPSWIDQRGAAATSAAVGQTLVAAIRSGGNAIAEGQNVSGTASVSPADHNRLALVVAVRHYRDPWPGADAKPAADPARLAASLQQKLGVPKDRLMLLEDELANRLDIEEALTRWLPERMGRETLLFVYFVGHTIVDAQTGEVYLVPYDAAPDAPFYRFLPLRRLHSHLNQLEAKLSLVFIDGPTTRVNSTSASAPAPSPKSRKPVSPVSPNWQGALDGTANDKGLVLQFARRESQNSSQGGNFLAGLDGSSDLNQDGQITVGELLRSLKARAVTVPLVSASSPEL
ncbi:MAG TPA: hypothetical protein VLA99_11975, partial [Nitrospiraceae bacterium]|nr:hypothetical protein [Nitrospiraceae bacterium]